MKFFSTILEALRHHVKTAPDKIVYTWVDIECKEQQKLTFQQLEDQSNAVAKRLLKLGCQKGDRIMVAYPFGLEFLAGMFGAMKIGAISCSIYPPNPNQLKTEIPKFRGFAEDAGAKYAITTSTFATAMTAASVIYKTGVTWIGTDKLSLKKQNSGKPQDYETYMGEPNEIAFIQYTSGSTGRPKGVMISHNNLVENCRATGGVSNFDPSSVTVLWVPQYHDMGLVAGFSNLYAGSHVIMTSPLDFLSRPLLWTDIIETYKATHTCAPNFAYALLLKRLKQANQEADWSSVKFAMFGAEPTQRSVVAAVVDTLGVQPQNICNAYGLAESVVFLTGGPAYPDSEGIICCGPVDSPTLKLRIVKDGNEVEAGLVGTIWAQSPRVAAGYYGQQELTASTFFNVLPGYEGSWLDTGDLGKIVDGQLYVTGRVKDVIIVNGKNYYPTDVELSVDEAFGNVVRPGRTAAFQHGDDSVGITLEGRKGFDVLANKDLAIKIGNHVSHMHGLFVSEVVVLKLGVTPKTTSGKLKRNEIWQTTIDSAWKKASVLLHLRKEESISPLDSPFPEREFGAKGITSSEFCFHQDIVANVPIPNRRGGGETPPKGQMEAFTSRFDGAIMSTFGSNTNNSKTWADNGLTSLKSAELRNRVEEEFHVVLPANFGQLYPNPAALLHYLMASKSKTFPTVAAAEHSDMHWQSARSRCSKPLMGLVQAIGALTILLLMLAAVVPSYIVGATVNHLCDTTDATACSASSWILLPLLFPLFGLSFSMLVVLCKLVVVGSYHPQEIDVMSWNYIKWWFVDRLMHLWEILVGRLLLETKLAWLFYWLLGADIAWSAKIDAFIREPDLLHVGANSSVGHSVRCRKFRPWIDDSPRMAFRPIVIESDCQVSGMVSPGAVIGAGSKVERLASVEEGAQVPAAVLARGSPAYNSGFFEPSTSNWRTEAILNLFKVVWIFVETYHFSALFFLAHAILNAILPAWRYGTLLRWFLAFPLVALLGLLSSAALKWLLIGRRDPSEEYEGTLWHQATNWACDYHFQIASLTFTPFFGLSKLGTVIQKLHGLEVDMASSLNTPLSIFCPSKVDFIKVQSSFMTATHIELDEPMDCKIEIIGSSLGYNSQIHSGTKLVRSALPPRAKVSAGVYDLNQPSINKAVTWGTVLQSFILPELSQVLLTFVVFWSTVPAYEIARAAASNPQPSLAALGIAAAVSLQLFLWIVFARSVEWVLLRLPKTLQLGLFGPYINTSWIFRVGNPLECLLFGTPMFPYYAQVMGAEVDGELWYYGGELYEYGKLHFKGRTIVDDAHLMGHYMDGNGLVIDDTYVSGVLHPGCYASAGSVVSGEENGPWKVVYRAEKACLSGPNQSPDTDRDLSAPEEFEV